MAVDKQTIDALKKLKAALPEREAGNFNSTGETGIEVDLELQFGTDLKDEKLLRDFITRFEKMRRVDNTDEQEN